MKLGIMQPYLFPYLGYFSLIKYTDKFILFDTVQFIRHGWIERNRVLKPVEGWQYISVPLNKHSRNTDINEITIKDNVDWQLRILRQLEHYKKRSPYYMQVRQLLSDCLIKGETSIVKLNAHCLTKICEYLGIPFNFEIFSEMDLKIGEVTHSGEWALRISEAMEAKLYVNPIGGKEIFDKKQFDNANIELQFLYSKLPEYSQRRNTFENGLSIIDVMMFNSPEEINLMLDNYEIT